MIYRQNIVLKRFNSIAQQVRTEEMCKNLLRMFFWHDYTPVKKRSIFTYMEELYKEPSVEDVTNFNSGMPCPPCLCQKLKIELKQTQFLSLYISTQNWLKMM